MSNLVDQGPMYENPAWRTGKSGDEYNRCAPLMEWPYGKTPAAAG